MAASAAMIGYGTLVYVQNPNSPTDSPPTYTQLDEILNVTPPNFQTDEVDVTHNTSPNRTREFIAGLIDPGEAGFEMNFIPSSASDIALRQLQTAGQRVWFKFVYPNNVNWEFLGIVKGYEVNSSTEDKMTVTVTLKTAGSLTVS